jgi:hypothetical protein
MKKVLLTLAAAAFIFSCNKKEEVKPADLRLNSVFKMDGDLKDSTGKLSAEPIDLTFGVGTAIFNGTSSYAKIPATGNITVPNRLSLSLSFKATYNDALQKPRLLQLIDQDGHAIEIYIENSRVALANWSETQKRNTVKIFTPSSPDMKAWHKVVATMNFETNEISLYVDNQLVRTVTGTPLAKPGKATLILGRHEHPNTDPADYYMGELDNVRIEELTAE